MYQTEKVSRGIYSLHRKSARSHSQPFRQNKGIQLNGPGTPFAYAAVAPLCQLPGTPASFNPYNTKWKLQWAVCPGKIAPEPSNPDSFNNTWLLPGCNNQGNFLPSSPHSSLPGTSFLLVDLSFSTIEAPSTVPIRTNPLGIRKLPL